MDREKFNKIINEQMQRSLNLLVKKSAEYATEDIFHNFHVAAELEGCSAKKALTGMMAKHTVSVYDMCCNDMVNYSIAQWNEKITDSINYLLILRALIEENADD